MTQSAPPSLDVVAALARDERMHRLVAYDALNNRAGGLAAVAVALIALTLGGWPPLVFIGTIIAASAAWIALQAFEPSSPRQFSPTAVRETWLTSDQAVATLGILDEELHLIEDLYQRNEHKAMQLTRATRRLTKAVGFLIAGLLVEVGSGVVDWIQDSFVWIGGRLG